MKYHILLVMISHLVFLFLYSIWWLIRADILVWYWFNTCKNELCLKQINHFYLLFQLLFVILQKWDITPLSLHVNKKKCIIILSHMTFIYFFNTYSLSIDKLHWNCRMMILLHVNKNVFNVPCLSLRTQLSPDIVRKNKININLSLTASGGAPSTPTPAAPAAAPASPAPAADYSAQWAEYYRSIGKMKEAEAIEAQIKLKVGLFILYMLKFVGMYVCYSHACMYETTIKLMNQNDI